jgi:UDP-glucose 4-epimerase
VGYTEDSLRTGAQSNLSATWDACSARVLVTGASGTLGFNIVRRLARDSSNLLLVPLRNTQRGLFQGLSNVKMVQADLSDPSQTRRLVEGFRPTVIIHCAASGVRPSRPVWFDMINFNVTGTLRLFEASCALPECHFIHISTGLVSVDQKRPLAETDPFGTQHPYGASKAAADYLLQAGATEFDRRLTILRPFSFTGIRDGGNRLFPGLLCAALSNTPLLLSGGEQIRDFCAVQDIAAAVEIVIHREHPDLPRIEVFNLGSGVCATLRETVEDVCDQLSLKVGLRFGELPYHPYEAMHLVANIEKARSIPWKPRVSLPFAVWELARAEFPTLPITRPREERV